MAANSRYQNPGCASVDGVTESKQLSLAAALTCVFAACSPSQQPSVDCGDSPGTLFEERIQPLLSSDHPNTCGQCHAAGIELAQFLRPNACESMACMKQQGLVDLENAKSSVILTFIERAQPTSELITQDVIDTERSAFLSWIEHEAQCGACQDTICPETMAPRCSTDDITLTPQDRESKDCASHVLERLFRATVYAWRDRCGPCHFQEEKTASALAPRWLSETGSCQVASLQSYQNAVASGYIDSDEPKHSPLLLKPLAEADGGVPHGGHDKMQAREQAYDDFVFFLERYASCQP